MTETEQEKSNIERKEDIIIVDEDLDQGMLKKFEKIFRVSIPLEGNSKLFIALIAANIVVFMISLSILIIDFIIIGILDSNSKVFFTLSYFIIGLCFLLLSVIGHFTIGRRRKVALSLSLKYYLISFLAILSFSVLISIIFGTEISSLVNDTYPEYLYEHDWDPLRKNLKDTLFSIVITLSVFLIILVSDL
jgi:hypothetical protein